MIEEATAAGLLVQSVRSLEQLSPTVRSMQHGMTFALPSHNDRRARNETP
jgi:hypothetical protein